MMKLLSYLNVRRDSLGQQVVRIGLILVAMSLSVFASRWTTGKPVSGELMMVVGVLGGLLILLRPLWGLYIMLALLPLENAYLIGGGTTLVKMAGFATLGAWLAQKIVRREELNFRHLFRTYAQVPLLILFVMWAFLSGLWAFDREAWLAGVMTYVQLASFFVLIYFQIDTQERLQRAIVLILLMASVSAIWGIVEFGSTGMVRGAGGLRSPNALGHMLAVLLPLPLFLRKAYPAQRWLWTGILIVFIAGVFATASRAAFLILAIVVTMEAYRARAKGVLVVAVLSALVLVLLPFMPTTLIQKRLEDKGLSDTSRLRLLRAGVAMAADHPFLGVGNGNFRSYYNLYKLQAWMRYELSSEELSLESAGKPSHNTYITILAELGSVGFVLFAATLWFSIKNLRSARRLAEVGGENQLGDLVMSLQTSFLAYLVSIAFANREDAKLLWVLLALCVVSHSLVRKMCNDQELSHMNRWGTVVAGRRK